MKKRGFTLAEILVTLGIIAVASAILAPAITNMRPDRYKFKVLDCYRLANEATEAMLSNPEIYYRQPIDSSTPTSAFLSNGMLNPNTQYGCNGLRCTLRPTLSQFNSTNYSGDCKYPNLMMAMLNLENVTQCTSSITEASGMMQSQIEWHIYVIPPASLNGYQITIDLDHSSNSANCAYTTCSNPDMFIFKVSPSGDISGIDKLTQVYLSNMANTDKSADFEEAAQP